MTTRSTGASTYIQNGRTTNSRPLYLQLQEGAWGLLNGIGLFFQTFLDPSIEVRLRNGASPSVIRPVIGNRLGGTGTGGQRPMGRVDHNSAPTGS